MTAEPCEPNKNVRLQPMFKLGKWCHTHERPISACQEIASLRSQLEEARAALTEALEHQGNEGACIKPPACTWIREARRILASEPTVASETPSVEKVAREGAGGLASLHRQLEEARERGYVSPVLVEQKRMDAERTRYEAGAEAHLPPYVRRSLRRYRKLAAVLDPPP